MIVIEDDFYPNPDEVRKSALEMFFYPGQKGNKNMFAGQRTLGSFSTQNRLYCKNRLEKLINRQIVQFPTNNSNASFTLGKEVNIQGKKYDNWVHMDKGNHEKKRGSELNSQMFAAVCYLSPDAPRGHGTALFRSNKNNSNWVTPEYSYNKTKGFRGEWKHREDEEWDLHTYVDNIYNRIVVYPATYWHAPYNAGFGYDKYSGRLIQIFFFYAEKSGVEKGYEQC
tara:strand:+ start:418 stop:1092 length:675 start_codon:yes stop_codon:yes gene_type:complete